MKSIKTTIPDIGVTVIGHGHHGIRVLMGYGKIVRDISDMLSDDIIEALTEELMESEDPLGIDVDIEEQESR